MNSLSLNYTDSSRSRTLLHVLLLRLLSSVISFPTYALSTSSESRNASNTRSSHLPTKFSQLPNHHTFITLSLFNVLAVLTVYPSLLLLARPLTSSPPKVTDRSFHYMFRYVSGINSLYLFVNLILVSVPPFPTHLYSFTSSSFVSPIWSISIVHSRLKTYPFHFLPDCLHGLLPRPFLRSYPVFVFSFPYFFSFMCRALD